MAKYAFEIKETRFGKFIKVQGVDHVNIKNNIEYWISPLLILGFGEDGGKYYLLTNIMLPNYNVSSNKLEVSGPCYTALVEYLTAK